MKFVWQNGRKVSPYFLKKDEIQESTVSSSSQSNTEPEEVPQASLPIVSPYFSNNNNPDSCSLKNKAIDLDTLFKQFEYKPSKGRDAFTNFRKVSPNFFKKSKVEESTIREVSPFAYKNKKPVATNALETLSKQQGRDTPSRNRGKKSKVEESTTSVVSPFDRFVSQPIASMSNVADQIGKMPKKARARKDEQIGKPRKKSSLSAAEMWNEAYRKRTPDNTWVPPPSNIPLIQEYHVHDPWRVLCVCILLNKTDGHDLENRTIIFNFFRLCPDAQSCIKVRKDEIKQVISRLGLQNKRSEKLQRFSREYLEGSWTHVTQLHGIGRYGADAYAIFCTGMWDRVTPHDPMLIRYWHFLHSIKHTL